MEHYLPVQTTSVSWLLSGDLFSAAKGSRQFLLLLSSAMQCATPLAVHCLTTLDICVPAHLFLL